MVSKIQGSHRLYFIDDWPLFLVQIFRLKSQIYGKMQGTNFVYDTFVRPYVAKHETEVDRKIMELRARAWHVFMHYWSNCSEMGLAKFFEMFQYLAGQSARLNQVPKQVNHVETVPKVTIPTTIS